ncbi:MAG: hypothetical protein VW453_13145, partial [Rhodospirillaceae bacterium]
MAPLAAGIDLEEPEHEDPDALVDGEFDGPPAGYATPPNDPGTKPPGPPVYVDLDDVYPMRRVPTRWEQRALRQNIDYLYLGGGAGGSPTDPTLRPDIDANTTKNAEQDGRLDALEAGGGGGAYDDTEVRGLISDNADGVADNAGRLDALEAMDPFDPTDLVTRLDQIDADQVVQDDAISDAAAEAAAASAKNTVQDGRLDALEASSGGGGGASLPGGKLTPTPSGAGATAWKAGEVYAQEGSHHDLSRMTHYTFPEFDLDGKDARMLTIVPGAVLTMENDAGDRMTATVTKVDPDMHAPTAAGRWFDVYVSGQVVTGDTDWRHWRNQNFVATFENVPVDWQPEIDRIDADLADLHTEQDLQNDAIKENHDGVDANALWNAEQDDRISLIESVEDSDGDIYGTYKCKSSSSAPQPGEIRSYPIGSPDSISLIDNIKIHRVGLNGNEHALEEIDAGEHITLTSPQKDWVRWTVVSSTDNGDWFEVEVDPASIVATDVNASWSSDFVNYTKVAFSLKQSGGGGGGGGSYDDTQVKADIAQNASDIADLVSAEAVQDGRLDDIDAEQIVQNDAIADAAADIATNKSDIAANAKALTDHEDDQRAHRVLIAEPDPDNVLLPDASGNPRGRLFRCFNSMSVGFESTGSYKPLIGLYRYAPGEPAGRALALDLHANGRIRRHVEKDAIPASGDYVWKEAMDEAIETAIDAIPDSTIDLAADYDWTGEHHFHRPGADDGRDWVVHGRTEDTPGSTTGDLLYVQR